MSNVQVYTSVNIHKVPSLLATISLQMALPLYVLCLSFRGLSICLKVPGLETIQMRSGRPCESRN